MRITIIAVALLLAGCSDAKKTFDDSFRISFEKNFVESCTTGAMSSGAPADRKPQVIELCTCTARALIAKHTTTELVAMGGGSNQEAIQAAAQGCVH